MMQSQEVPQEVKGTKWSLDAARSGRDIILTNGVAQVRLIFQDGGYIQEFYGIDRKGDPRMLLSTIHRNLIPFTEHRMIADPMISSHERRLFEVNRDSLRMVYSDAQVEETEERISIRLSGQTRECVLASTITLTPGSKFIKVTSEVTFLQSKRPPLVEYVMASYAFLPDEMLLDHYNKLDYAWAPSLRPEHDHIVAERSFKSAAVVAQYRKLLAAIVPDPSLLRQFPTSLDLDLASGLISAPLLSYGYCMAEPDGHFSYHDRSMLLRPGNNTIKLEFRLYLDADASLQGGVEPIQELLWSHSRHVLSGKPPEPLVIEPPGDDLPSAYAMKVGLGLRGSSQKAEHIITRTLARQREMGFLEAPPEHSVPGHYDTAFNSELCRWLLAIHSDAGGDLRLLGICKTYGDFLLANQVPSGAIPSWLSRHGEPLPEMRSSMLTAASGRFLADLYENTWEHAYLTAAGRAARHITNLITRQRYHDRQVFLSGALGIQDQHTMISPQGAEAMRYAADLMISLYRITNEQRYLKSGMQALNQLCWLQDTWSNHPGAFSAGNAFDAHTSQAMIGRTLLEYYEVTHNPSYLERGIAAIRAGLAVGASDAAAIRLWAIRRFGSALIDLRSHAAYALGPCSIEDLTFKPGTISFSLRNGVSGDGIHPFRIRFNGLKGDYYRIFANGEGKRYPKVELESGIEIYI